MKNNEKPEFSGDKHPEDITINDVVQTMVGVDKDGDTKVVIYITIAEVFPDEEKEPQVKKQLILHNVYLSGIGYPGRFVMTELEFKLMSNSYMRSFCEMVTEFHLLDEPSHEYVFLMTIAGVHDDAKFILSFDCPLICLQGYSDFSKAPTKLQVVFPLEGFNLYPANYSLTDIRAEVGRELDEEESIYGERIGETLHIDVEEEIKESYGINKNFILPGEKKNLKSNIDDHIRITK